MEPISMGIIALYALARQLSKSKSNSSSSQSSSNNSFSDEIKKELKKNSYSSFSQTSSAKPSIQINKFCQPSARGNNNNNKITQ